jgi:hypothetical protein
MFAGLGEILCWGGGSVALSLGGLYLSKKILKQIDVRGNVDILVAVVTIVGTLVSVVLGLLVSSSVDQYRTMESSVDAEASAIVSLFRMSRGLPAKTGSVLQSLCIDYCDHTISDEWPAMKRGGISHEVTAIYARLNDQIVGFQPATVGESNIQQSLLSELVRVGDNRRARVVAVQSNWTQRMLPILFMCTIIVLAITYIYADEKPSKLHTVLVAFVAIALGSNIGLMCVMSRPFASTGSIAPDQFELNAKVMREYKDTPLFGTH